MRLKFFSILIVFLSFALAPIDKSRGDENYVFERMWPVNQSQWFFSFPTDIISNSKGNIFVVDSGYHRIKKFTSSGVLITQWGKAGGMDGEFFRPASIALDQDENIYVTDAGNCRIQKFDANGAFIMKFGNRGAGNGEFDNPAGVAINNNGDIYIADALNYRIQKFDSAGRFLTKWGKRGDGQGEFELPDEGLIVLGVNIDKNGLVYIADAGNHRIQIFSPDGVFISAYGQSGSSDGEFRFPLDIAFDKDGNILVAEQPRIQKFDGNWAHQASYADICPDLCVYYPCGLALDGSDKIYIADSDNNRIIKLDSDGSLLAKWGTDGNGDGDFFGPGGVAIDTSGNIYIGDCGNDRIQQFDPNGVFIKQWNSPGGGAGIAVDRSGNIYSANPAENLIYKYDADGSLIKSWKCDGDGCAPGPYPAGLCPYIDDIVVDSNNNIYVLDGGKQNIQKYTSDGIFVTKWGQTGSGESEFDFHPDVGMAIDASDNIYIADPENCKILIFDVNGDYVSQWGACDWQDGVFYSLNGLHADDDGHLFITNNAKNSIYKYTADGRFITEFGELGWEQGGFSGPGAVSVASNGYVYVADTNNNRVQVFKPADAPSPTTKYPKAIVVAGGGPYAGNSLWDATQLCANFAYRALLHQGYTKDTIYYISHDTDLDLDGNGELDDVDAAAVNANLQSAVATWAAETDTEDLLLYMVDHGGDGAFRMGGTELLYAADLDAWLDALQETMPGGVIVVYDACMSGSFLSALAPASGRERILVSSAAADQEAIFASYGRISFSYIFWASFFEGNSFYNAFVHASHGVDLTYSQDPQIDANGNGVGNEKDDKTLAEAITVGAENLFAGDIPVIGGVSPDQSLAGEISARLYARDVIDADGVSRVWAVITPPNYDAGSPDNPVTDLPLLDFTNVGGNRYEADYNQFGVVGAYNIAIYAADLKGVMGIPLNTLVTQTVAIQGSSVTAPDIKANGSDAQILVAEGSPVTISLSMASGDNAGQNTDWWILELAPDLSWNYFFLSALSFTPGLRTTHQGPLVDLTNVQVLSRTDLSPGDHVFVFGVETNMNGIPDVDQLFYDTVTVSIYEEWRE